jgi:hypothetical protein
VDAKLPLGGWTMAKSNDEAVTALHHITIGLVKDLDLKLPLLQMTMFLMCYLDERKYTVRDLTLDLNRHYAEVRRAVMRLVELDLVACGFVPYEHSLIEKTGAGKKLLAVFCATIEHAVSYSDPRTNRRLPAGSGRSAAAAEGAVAGRG